MSLNSINMRSMTMRNISSFKSFFLLPVFLLSITTISHSATSGVTMQNFSFSPQSLTINSGDNVNWLNQGGVHTVTSGTGCTSDGRWNSGSVSFGGAFEKTLTEPGTYPYFCAYHCSLGMTGTIVVNAVATTMPLPSGQQIFDYSSLASPVESADPAQARPVGAGPVATGGTTLSIRVKTIQLSGSADVYFGIFAPVIDPSDVYILLTDGTLRKLSAGLAPWKAGVSGPLNEALFGDIPVSTLPSGQYILYLAITPTGSFSTFYLYQTSFAIP